MNNVSKETFRGYPVESKIDTLFDMLHEISDKLSTACPARFKECNARFDKIESRKWIHAGMSFVGGAIGGFGAFMGKWLVGK